MAILPCQGPFSEGGSSELYSAFFGARAHFEDGFSSFDPLGQSKDSSGPTEKCGFTVHEIFISTPLCMRGDFTMSGVGAHSGSTSIARIHLGHGCCHSCLKQHRIELRRRRWWRWSLSRMSASVRALARRHLLLKVFRDDDNSKNQLQTE